MKSLLIETVSNGWIVRPFTPSTEWACADAPVISVFNSMEALIFNLPKLLSLPPDQLPKSDFDALRKSLEQ